MRAGSLGEFLGTLRRASWRREADVLTDGQLLENFIDRGEQGAFEALVQRHGPRVLGVCRRILRHTQDAEDAFQATFLVLARKAATLQRRDLVGNWLYGVASKAALETRAARRDVWEQQVHNPPEPAVPPFEQDQDETRHVLERELNRLPSKYRVPLVLCYLEGWTCRSAAQHLGIPAGTCSGRLRTGRQLLAARLTRRGVTLATTALAVLQFTPAAQAQVARSLVRATAEAATRAAAGDGAGSGSTLAAAVANRLVRSMLLARVARAAAVIGALLLTGFAAGVLAQSAGPTPALHRQEIIARAAPVREEAGYGPIKLLQSQVYFLCRTAVQEELRLSADVVADIARADTTVRERYAAAHARAVSRQDDAAINGINGKIHEETSAAMQKIVAEKFQPPQVARLRQMDLQLRGRWGARVRLGALADPVVQARLRLSDVQKQRLRAIDETLKRDWDAQPDGMSSALRDDVRRELYHAAVAWATALLTDTQRRQWRQMLGPPFDPNPPRESPGAKDE